MTTSLRLALAAGLLLAATLFALSAPAQQVSATPAEALPSADDIIARVNARHVGESARQTIRMKLIDKDDSTRERVTRGFGKTFGDDKRLVLFFLEPANVKGTALLTYDYGDPAKTDDQWLYLPAMRKVRRISAGERGGSFLGTDFTFEDIKDESSASLTERTWKTIGREEVDGHACFVVEGTPATPALAKDLGYARMTACIDADLYLVRRSDFFDDAGTALKTISVRDYQQVKDIWTAMTLEARNLKTAHATVFTISDVDYNMPLPDDLFTVQALERGLPDLPAKP